MKLNIVTHSISNDGGVSRASIDLANALVKQGIIVKIISLGGSSLPKYDLNNNVQIIDLKMSKPSTESYKGKLKALWFIDAANVISSLLLRTQQNNKDIWIFTSPPLCMLAGILKLKFKSSIFIGHEHTTSIYTKGKIIDSIRYKIYRNLDMLIALTESDQRIYNSLGIKSTYIPNFFSGQSTPITNRRKYALYVGRFSKEKRPLLAIQAYNKSGLYHQGIKLRMFGSGPLEEDIRNYIDSHNLEDQVEVYEGVNDANEIYKDGYILLMTSETEGFGLVLIEAISRNIPCISYDIPHGPQSIIIDEKNGFLVNPGDHISYINKLKSEKVHCLFNRNIYHTVDKFKEDRVIPVWLNLMQELVNK